MIPRSPRCQIVRCQQQQQLRITQSNKNVSLVIKPRTNHPRCVIHCTSWCSQAAQTCTWSLHKARYFAIFTVTVPPTPSVGWVMVIIDIKVSTLVHRVQWPRCPSSGSWRIMYHLGIILVSSSGDWRHLIPGLQCTGENTRASNEGSRRFHNNREGPYLDLLLFKSTY